MLLVNIRDIYLVLAVVAGLVILISGIGVLYLFKTKKGRFNKQSINLNVKNEIVDIIPDEFIPKTKEEEMEAAYQDFNNGKITEEQLNAILRKIWWEEND